MQTILVGVSGNHTVCNIMQLGGIKTKHVVTHSLTPGRDGEKLSFFRDHLNMVFTCIVSSKLKNALKFMDVITENSNIEHDQLG